MKGGTTPASPSVPVFREKEIKNRTWGDNQLGAVVAPPPWLTLAADTTGFQIKERDHAQRRGLHRQAQAHL